jgi:hypothetical protein
MRGERRVRRRFWVEAGVVTISLAIWVATLLWPDWIELVFRIDPDESNGSLERLISILVPATAFVAAIVAGIEWRATTFRTPTSRR